MRCKFEDIVTVGNEKRTPTIEDTDTYVGLEHLESDTIIVSRFGSRVPLKSTMQVMKKGDVLFGRRNAYLRRTGIAPHDGLCSADIMILHPKENVIDREFLPFFVSSDYFFDIAERYSAGSIMQRVMWSRIKDVEFDLPPLVEQRKLADLLWTATAMREAYKKLLMTTEELVKSQFIEMFNNSPKEKIGEVCTIKARIGWQGLKKDEYLTEGNYHLVTGVDFKDNRIDFNNCFYVTEQRYSQDAHIQLQPEDVLITKDGTIGKVAIIEEMLIPATLNSGVFVVRDRQGLLKNRFIFYSLMTDEFNNFVEGIKTGSTIAHLNQGAFVNYEIPVPPLERQNTFIQFAKQVDKSKFELQRTLEELEATYKALLREKLG